MESLIYPIAIGLGIVILSLAVAIVAIIKARYKYNVNVEDERWAMPMSKKEIKAIHNDGLTGRSVPISKEEFCKCRGEETTSYQEMMFVEQLLSRITMCRLKRFETNANFLLNHTIKTQFKIDVYSDLDVYATRSYLQALNAGAYWFKKGKISFELYNYFFLDELVKAYDEIYTAQFYAKIKEVVEEYRHIVDEKEESDHTSDEEEE